MADRNNPGPDVRPAIADDDPFAELTRIMGFDPREPVRAAAPVAMSPLPVAAQAEPAAPEPSPVAPTPAPAVEPDFGIDLERELMGEFGEDDALYARDEPAPAVSVAPLPEMEFVHADAVPDEEPAAGAFIASGRGVDAVASAAELDIEDEFFLALDDHFAPEPQAATVAGSVERDPIAALIADDVAAEASALPAQPTIETAEPVPDILPSYEEMRHAVAQDVLAGVNAAPAEDHGEREPALDDRAPAAGALSGFVAVSQDDSLVEGLEEELNALLGSEMNQPAPAAQVAVVEPEPASVETYAVPHAPASGHRTDMRDHDVASPETAEPDEIFDEAFRDESWLDGRDADINPDIAEAAGAPFAQEAALDASTRDEFDLDLDLDDHDFDAALSNAIAGDLVGAPQPEPTHVNAASTIKEPQPMSRDGNDPYAALAALSANLKNAPSWPEPSWPEPARPAASAPSTAAYGRDDAPDIETVEVPEHAVALADDLDLPEFTFEEKAPKPSLNDLDAEFATLLNDMKTPEPDLAAVPVPRYDDRRSTYDGGEDPDMRAAMAAGAAALAADEVRPSRSFDDDDDYEASSSRSSASGLDLDYDPDFEDDVIPSAYVASAEPPPQRRGLLLAALVGGVALIGAAGAFALSSSTDGNNEIALVKADPSPVKVKPENPGGVAIANQDNKVYDTVGRGTQPAEPRQEKLLSSAEEPVDIPVEEEADMADGADDTMPGLMQDGEDETAEAAPAATGTTGRVAAAPAPATAKGEDRVEQAETADAGVDATVEVSAVAPRKVRTMIVKADGTLVAREETEEPVAAPTPASASESIVDGGAPAASQDAGADEVAPAASAPAAAGSQASATKSAQTPKSIPVAPSRPSDQPVDIVGATKPEQVAALAPAATGGAWAMQIASQPSESAAKSSYQDLVRRYGTVLEGRQASIVKAEIAGKGTFWRVRVPAGGRSDAVQLCERYKAAGGSCFVSK